MARILIIGGGCRGRQLAREVRAEGHAVRITTRTEERRAAIEASGAECWIGTPDRLATLRGALDGATVLCWLMGTASGEPQELAALHSTRLEFFLTQAIDTTVRGFIYEAPDAGLEVDAGAQSESAAGPAGDLPAAGAQRARTLATRNAIPAVFLTADPHDPAAWLAEARSAVDALLARA